jgi:DNA modification methylase
MESLMVVQEQTLEYIAVKLLKPSKRNARTHSKKQVAQIEAAIRQFGFRGALLVDEHNIVVAGHGRLAAAISMGLDTLPCIRVTGLSDAEKHALMLADNKIASNAGWDMEMLAFELEELSETNFDFSALGFDQVEVDNIIAAASEASPECQVPEDQQLSPPGPRETVTRAGDLWQLGRHRLLCGSSRIALDVDRLMNGELADAVFADPPYNCRILGNVSGLGLIKHREFAEASGEMSPDEYRAWLHEINVQIERVCRNGAIVYICIDWRHLQEALAAGFDVFTDLKNLCVWAKTNAGMGTFYRSQHELILVWKVGDAPHVNNFGLGETGRHRTNLWTYAGVNSFRADRMEELSVHPTVKPVALVSDAIRDVSKRGGIILDPFGGSGTTLIAAEKTGRAARLMEIDPAYCDVIIQRWQTLTGKHAVLEGGWGDFETIKVNRSQIDEIQAEAAV